MDSPNENPEPRIGANAERNKRKKELAKQKKLKNQEEQRIADTLNASINKQAGNYANSVEPLFEVKPIPGKGLGLVARRFISRGTEILREDAILKCNREFICKEISLMNVPNDKKARFMELQSQCNCDQTPCLETPFQRIFELNCFGFYAEKDFRGPSNTYIYLISARINHDCMPNTAGAFTEEEYVTVQAIKDIHPGEEITRDYHNLRGTTQFRRTILQQHYKFVCECTTCVSNTTITEAQAMVKFAMREKPRNTTTTLLHKATPEEIKKDKDIDQWFGARLVDFAILQRAVDGTVRAQAAQGISTEECTNTILSLLGGIKKNLEDNNAYGLSEELIETHASILTQAAFEKMMAHFAKLKAQFTID
ncbi:uncharacterized protein PAC_18905 [Phialocephala subalpina]|uniref:SET domain-containing protein n=1 Tax=Phialocephala subalpina TaxID=576137 RepID=A0A1L7XVC6_9HELO|nr:uncharacterized protein PAC_18905 [Phialocephala subalpina]